MTNGLLTWLHGGAESAPSTSTPGDVLAVALLLLILIVPTIGGLLVWLVSRQLRTLRLTRMELEHADLAGTYREAPAFSSALFHSPTRWLAIRSADPQSVQATLGLRNTAACSWEEGLAHARDRRLFISPPVGEWVLVVGSGLPDPSEDVDACFHFLTGLSRKLGHVQFFSADRLSHHHAWARLEDGRVCRAYAWDGRTRWNQGRLTLTEMDLNLKCFAYGESGARTDFNQPDPAAMNTDKVARLAARWSVDPAEINERQLKSGHGIAGDLSSRPF